MTGDPTIRLHEKNDGVTIECRVTPRAGRTAIKGVRDGVLSISLAAPPVEGRANDELCDFFASLLDLPRSRIEIIRGSRGRHKIILFHGMSKDGLMRALSQENVA